MNRQSVTKAQKPTNPTLHPPADILQRKMMNRTDVGTSTIDTGSPSGQQIDKPGFQGTESHFSYDFSKIPVTNCSPYPIQAKLKISQPNDKYEHEADRVAEQVMSMPDPQYRASEQVYDKAQTTQIQRTCDECEEVSEDEELIQTKKSVNETPKVTPAISVGIQSLKDGGRSLSRSERSFFEPRFGADFSNVRIHNNVRAASVARSVNARAFTFGHNVVFGTGEYSSDASSGRQLLAHELMHVVQQNKGSTQTNTDQLNKKDLLSPGSSSDDMIMLNRNPDVVNNGYYSFYLLAGGRNEIAVQIHYTGSGNTVTVKMASMHHTSLVQESLTLSNPSMFVPEIIYEDGVTTLIDLDGDGNEDIQIHVTMDTLYSDEFLTSDSDPGDPRYQIYDTNEIFAVMKWPGVERTIRVTSGTNQPWVIRPHPDPRIQFMYYNTVTRAAFIPSRFTTSGSFRGVSLGRTIVTTQDITVLDWGESWNGFNIMGGVVSWDQIDAASVESMVRSIENRIPMGSSCIGTLTIIGHGSPGSISVGAGTSRIAGRYIGGGALDSTSDIYDHNLAMLLARLTPKFCSTGNVVLRGCNVGDGVLGVEFAQRLANLWRVNVRAHIGTVMGGGYWTTGNWTSTSPTTVP